MEKCSCCSRGRKYGSVMRCCRMSDRLFLSIHRCTGHIIFKLIQPNGSEFNFSLLRSHLRRLTCHITAVCLGSVSSECARREGAAGGMEKGLEREASGSKRRQRLPKIYCVSHGCPLCRRPAQRRWSYYMGNAIFTRRSTGESSTASCQLPQLPCCSSMVSFSGPMPMEKAFRPRSCSTVRATTQPSLSSMHTVAPFSHNSPQTSLSQR